jgi:Na+/melibiose symporter-like transporter
MAAMLTSFLLTPGNPSFVIYVFATVVGLGTGGIVVMIYAIFPDIPDVDELNTGQRREGIYAALVTFARKLSSAVAIFAVSNAIAWAGYITPVEETSGGITRLVEQPQSATFILVLRAIFALVPIALLLAALIFASRYPLNSQIHLRLNRLLATQRMEETLSDEQRTESAELRRILIGK